MEINIKNLTFKYPNYNKDVLANINLKIEKSKITGIIGQNGSGKTTLIDLICNLLKPTDGVITYNNKALNTKDIGYVFQNSNNQFFCNTVKEELVLSARINKYRLNEIDKRVKDVLKIVKLDESILNENPLNLSDNQSKSIALATILMYNPKVIVLDEPTINYDKKEIDNFIKLIRMLKNRYKKTIIIVSQDVDMLHKIVDNIIVLYKGRVVETGDKYTVFRDTKQLKKYGLLPPKLIMFSDKVLNKKGIKIGYRDEINDLIKDIFRNVN